MLNRKKNRFDNNSKCNSFLSKLYDILNDNAYKKIICWNNEGTCIIISDMNKFCNNVLPKYFKHNNYSSFVRQLNIYGFRKCQGLTKDEERYENEKFNKKITKEEITKLKRHNKKIELFSNFIKNNDKINSKDNEELSINNENDILKFLLEKNEENKNNITELKKEVLELKNQKQFLIDQMKTFKDGHAIILTKLMKKKVGNKINYIEKKPKDIKELFKKYLYFLKIYSPYVIMEGKNNKYYKSERVESFQIDNINNNKIMLNKGNYNNNSNPDSFFSNISFMNNKQFYPIFDFNLYNNNSSNSLFNNKNLNK